MSKMIAYPNNSANCTFTFQKTFISKPLTIQLGRFADHWSIATVFVGTKWHFSHETYRWLASIKSENMRTIEETDRKRSFHSCMPLSKHTRIRSAKYNKSNVVTLTFYEMFLKFLKILKATRYRNENLIFVKKLCTTSSKIVFPITIYI